VTINFAGSEEDIEQTSEGPKITDLEELTMKLDPLIPDEAIREAVYTYPNCQGEEMAKRYAVSHLQKSCWSIYQGDLVILGNPSIKPYDIVFVYDEYTDMYGPVQVRRITHMFDYEHGFISVITPDLLTTVTEGVTMSNLHAMGLMSNRDFNNYTSLFELMESLVGSPDLLIYLRSSIPNLVSQIHKRGRDYENSISIDYLSRLNERYEAWIQTYDKGKLVIIDVDNFDFVNNPEDLGTIINRIDAELNGLF
jgi:hypothetical protein